MQHDHGPTNLHGHTLDLVLSHDLSYFIVSLDDVAFSDHKSVSFEISFKHEEKKPSAPTRCVDKYCVDKCRCVLSTTFGTFVNLFFRAPFTTTLENPPSHWDAEKLLNVFNLACSSILDTVAPTRIIPDKPKPQPWFNETTQLLGGSAERQSTGENDGLEVSLEIFKDSLSVYQNSVKAEKRKFLSVILARNHHKPRILFSTINSLINPSAIGLMEGSLQLCESFFF